MIDEQDRNFSIETTVQVATTGAGKNTFAVDFST